MHPPNNPPSPQPSDHHIYQSTTVDPNHLTTLTTPFSLADFLNDENSTTTTTTPPPSFHDHTQEIQTPAHVMNPFAFYDSHDHSQDTSANMNSPAAYDLYINLMNDAVSEATREFATPFVSDPQTSETASLSPDSSLPSSPVMDQAIYYNNITHSTSETLSNGYSSPISTLPVVDQNMFLYDPAPLHNNSSSTRSNRKSPKSRSRSRARIGSKLSPETDANGSKIFTCEYPTCDKTFKRLEHMKRHVRSLHTLEKPFTCPDRSCGKRFARSDNLNQHIRTHQQTKEKQEQDEQQNEANHNSLNPSMQSYNANVDGMVV